MPKAAIVLALIAILIWSSLAVLSAQLTHLPPFLSVGIALCVSGIAGAVKMRAWLVPLKTFLVGLGGIFGYHFLLFTAYQHAPVVEASLMNYLWPLLIVLLSPLYLRGYHLRWNHLVGALVGMAGASLIVTGGKFALDQHYLAGYLYAAAAAFIWASYSLLTKRLPPFPTAAVGGFCFFSGILSLALFLPQPGSVNTILALKGLDWLFLVLLGLGPMGSAFFAWDAALKRGDPRIIGSLSYLTPFLATSLLVFVGGKQLTFVSGMAMLLIVTGAVIGSLEMFCQK